MSGSAALAPVAVNVADDAVTWIPELPRLHDHPLAVGPALATLAAHAIPGCEVVDVEGRTVTRLVETCAGPVALTITLAERSLAIGAVGPGRSEKAEITAAVTRWFDADADLEAVHRVLGADALLAPALQERPGLRVMGHPAGFEAAVTTVLGQQVSLAACRTFAGRLAAAYGTPGPAGLTVFPTADVLAGVPAEELQQAVRITGARARTLRALAELFADGLELAPHVDHVRAALLAVPGIGPWTVDYLTVRVLGDRDALVPGDLVLRRALGGIDAKSAARVAEAWAPYRAYALFHLWTREAYVG